MKNTILYIEDFPFYAVATVRRYVRGVGVFVEDLVVDAGHQALSIPKRLGRAVLRIVSDGESLTFLAVLLVPMLILRFRTDVIFFLLTFVAFRLYEWDSRIVGAGALLTFAASPLLIVAGNPISAEKCVVYAFYLLILTVILQILERTCPSHQSRKKAHR